MGTNVKLSPSWLVHLNDEFDLPYMHGLREFLRTEKAAGKTIYPKNDEIFNALNSTAFEHIKVVILGQDPYHGPGQAHGLSFSVLEHVPLPPSLLNIYKELAQEYNAPIPKNGNLSRWADQGVLLLNATLTVQQSIPGSHQNKGWERFTDRIIQTINEQKQNVVFLLWGSYAQKKGTIIDRNRHLVLTAPHPSPLSAHRGFLGCGHFRKANDYLLQHGLAPIKWVE